MGYSEHKGTKQWITMLKLMDLEILTSVSVSFSDTAPKIWNSQPLSLKQSSSKAKAAIHKGIKDPTLLR